MPHLLIALVAAATLFLTLLLSRVLRRRRAGSRVLPPGPSGWPLIGNVFDMPTSHEWKKFAEWGDKWGDLVSVSLLGQTMVIVNSSRLAFEMLDKKSSIYSDRPVLTMCEMIGWDRALGLTRYGTKSRRTRRLFHQIIGSNTHVQNLSEGLESEVHRFLGRVLRQPDTLSEQVVQTSGAIILKIAYGYRIQEGPDALVDLVNRAMEEFSIATAPGAFLVDVLPFLRHVPAWVPGAQWKRKVQAWRKNMDMMRDVPYAFTKERMANSAGMTLPNFTSMQLETVPDAEEESLIKDVAASMYSGGADTTVSAIRSFFLAMTCYPEIQRKAQTEIDTVVGHDRLPTLADREPLPYVNALCLEVLRWQPVAPLGLPHRLMKDDIHAGYLLPEGAIVIPNIWKFLHDPDHYVDPFVFNPDRFIKSGNQEPEQDPRQVVFGFGRRICPGLHLAETSIFLSCAMSLAVFDIGKPTKNGVVIEPAVEYASGTVSHPLPYECSIKPRSATAEALIMNVHASELPHGDGVNIGRVADEN